MRKKGAGLHRAHGFTLIEIIVALGIFSILTVGMIPLIAAGLQGSSSAAARTVGRATAVKAMERIRGLPYFVSFGSVPRRVDLLDLYFPTLTPPSGGTGYSSGTYTTTCTSSSTAPACLALPGASVAPEGYTTVVTAQFVDEADATTVKPPPAGYAWDSTSGADAPPTQLLDMSVTATWTHRGRSQTFAVRSLIGARKRGSISSATPPPVNATPVPGQEGSGTGSLLVRSEAKVDYTVSVQAGLKDLRSGSLAELTGQVGPVVASGEVRTDGSSADVNVQAGQVRVARPENPSPSPSPSPATAYDASVSASSVTQHAPPSVSTSQSATSTVQTLLVPTTEMSPSGSMPSSGAGSFAPVESWSVADPARGGGPVAGALPYARGYYDFNTTSRVSGCLISTCPYPEMWMGNQAPNLATNANPLALSTGSSPNKGFTLGRACPTGTNCGASDFDARGEATISTTDLSNPAARVVQATSTTRFANAWMLAFGGNAGVVRVNNFTATADCQAKADPSAASTASVTWSATLQIYSQTDGNNGKNTLAYTSYAINNSNAASTLASIRSTNPLVHDPDNAAANDRYLFTDAASGKKGYLVDWGSSAGSTTISADDRAVSAVLDGALRVDTVHTYYGGSTPSNEITQSDWNVSMGKLSCSAEDYR
jgi:prepilin-type N-terminal cleavage/methylation domain-containing protein